ncbi:MAG: arylsulfatase [Akkermansiaceae bacterium]|nr:arylsulfatase [Akkermansiaceae bacterium]
MISLRVLLLFLVLATGSGAKPNIVIILVDDMGYGDPACFNPESKIITPNIDSLARNGMKFTDAHAPGPLCHMSRYGLLTGRYPFRTDVTKWPKQPLITAEQMTIASLAKSQGYTTAMVGKWHLGFRENGYEKPLKGGPIDRGFDSYFGIRASTDIPPYFYIRGDKAVQPPSGHIEAELSENWHRIQGRMRRAGGISPDMNLDDVLPKFTDEATKIIASHDQKNPLMLYLAYPAPHTPWLPSKEFLGKSKVSIYGDFVMMVDAQIGRVLTALKSAKMEEDTLVIFTSDNGPCWFDKDVKKFGHDSQGGLRGMKADAWEAGHRMPFIARWPKKVKSGTTSKQLICFTDFLATFADIMGSDLPDEAGPDSFSFLPALSGKSSSRDTFVMRAGSAAVMTIREGDWKLITKLGSGGFSKPKIIKSKPDGPQGQLYHLGNDLSETNNLYLKHPEIVARLSEKLEQLKESPHRHLK